MLEYLKLIYYYLRPHTIIIRRISNAMGDCLLLSIVLQGLRKKFPHHKIIIECKWPELFDNNPLVDWVTRRHINMTKRHIKPKYRILPNTRDSVYKQISQYSSEKEIFYPEIYLTKTEIEAEAQKFPFPYIAICPVGKAKFSANRKEWGIEKFQRVVDNFPNIKFIQIGSQNNPLMENVIDARGLAIRESAAVLKNAGFFIGLEGGLMHLAKAVNIRSVIIYGGFIKPELSQYKENLNIVNIVDCSPCFSSEEKHTNCPTMKCMKAISVKDVTRQIGENFKEKLKKILGENK
ncbi:MAG: glycosyltransferase family 9 protein [Candidatus Cloacimonetes bacterium]|jgi:ADP-heptose:LPS heptosyltransferase|nr:glycosyltransferase family 9 protein [Candidatus Cloacimonadota bacterium]